MNQPIVIQSLLNGATSAPLFPGFPLPAAGSNYPLRGQKNDHYEGGIRSPVIYLDARLPANTRGTLRNFLLHITDWLPTFRKLSNKGAWRGLLTLLNAVKEGKLHQRLNIY